MRHLHSRTLARWFNGTCSDRERRRIERHFTFCPICQGEITIEELTEIAADARRRLEWAIGAAERN